VRSRISDGQISDWAAARDTVVVCTGAGPTVEGLDGAEDVRSMENAAASIETLRDPVIVIDEVEDEPVYAFSEMLAGRAPETVRVARRAQLGRHVAYVSLIGVLRRLDQRGVVQHTLAVPARIEGGILVVRHPFSDRESRIGRAGTIVRAGPYRSRPPDI